MDDNTKKESEQVGPEWLHDQELSFKKPRQALLTLKEAVEKALEQQKKELQKYVAMRDSFK